MKKSFLFILLLLSFNFINSLQIVRAEANNSDIIGSLQNLPSDPDELREKYLNQEWSALIKNSTIIGPMHSFFLSIPLPFIILFGQPYSFSARFFLLAIIWLYVMAIAADILASSGLLKRAASIPIGIGIAIIL